MWITHAIQSREEGEQQSPAREGAEPPGDTAARQGPGDVPFLHLGAVHFTKLTELNSYDLNSRGKHSTKESTLFHWDPKRD